MTLTQLKLVQDGTSGRLSLEQTKDDEKAPSPKTRQERAQRTLILAKRNPEAVAKKIKFTAVDSMAVKTTEKRPSSKGIAKKPATKFIEFQLSHQKPKGCGRRALLEDLFKTNEKEKTSLLMKRARMLSKSGSATSELKDISTSGVCRRLFFGK